MLSKGRFILVFFFLFFFYKKIKNHRRIQLPRKNMKSHDDEPVAPFRLGLGRA